MNGNNKNEERWQAMFDNSSIPVALANPDGVFTSTNRAFQDMVGYTNEELRTMTFLEITHEEDRRPNQEVAGQLWAGTLRRFTHEKRYRRKNGDVIWVRNTVSLTPGTDAVPKFAVAIVEDITERKRTEEQLRRSERHLSESQTLSHVGSWAIALSPREVVFWSQEHYRIFGFDPDQGLVSIDTAMARIHAEDRPLVQDALDHALQSCSDFDIQYRIVLPDGIVKYCHTIGHPMTNENGEFVEFHGTVADITHRKQAEEELRHSFEQLRALAARLQSVREEERTRVAREIHDRLGQALTAIKMDLAALVSEMPAPPSSGHRVGRILDLVDETIRSVRRIATELRPGILDDLGLIAALEWAADEFHARTGIKCHVSMPTAEIAVDPDSATALFRIFQETLTNVARHANATEVDVVLTCTNGDLCLEVHDNGRGILEEELSGTQSLGIVGMRERALVLGGELDISGPPEAGTTVKMRIPRTAAKDVSICDHEGINC